MKLIYVTNNPRASRQMVLIASNKAHKLFGAEQELLFLIEVDSATVRYYSMYPVNSACDGTTRYPFYADFSRKTRATRLKTLSIACLIDNNATRGLSDKVVAYCRECIQTFATMGNKGGVWPSLKQD